MHITITIFFITRDISYKNYSSIIASNFIFQEGYLFNSINKALIHPTASFIHYTIKSKNVK